MMAFAIVATVLPGSAAPTAGSPDRYVIRSRQAEEGLPQNTVTSLAQTRDGYIWVGTYSGLARFDGVRFTVFDHRNTAAIRSSGVTSLFEADDGALWIGHERGEVTRLYQGRFEPLPVPAGVPANKVHQLATDENADLWGLIEPGLLVRYRDGLVLTPQAGTAGGIRMLERARDGTLWVVRDGLLSHLVGGHLKAFRPAQEAPSTYIHGIGDGRHGLWVASEGQVRQRRQNGWSEPLFPAPWGVVPANRIVETANGELLVSTADQGFFVVPLAAPTNYLRFGRGTGFASDWATSVITDREGGIWLGTGGAGLFELRPRRVHTLNPPDQWQGRAILGLCAARDGSLWVGTEGAGVYRYTGGGWEKFGSEQGIHLYSWSLVQDRGGAIWLGTWGGGLFCRKQGSFERVEVPGATDSPFPALAPGMQGDLWVGTDNGIIQLRDNESRFFGHDEAERLALVRSLAVETNGTVWFGTAGTGLGRLTEGQIRIFTRRDGLSGDYIQTLHLDATGALWIGTAGAGLNRYQDGKFAVIDRTKGLPDDTICHIAEDDRGYFWMNSHNGLIRVRRQDLVDCAAGRLETITSSTYGISDGMPTVRAASGMSPAGARSADGRLWFPTSKGLVYVDPAQVLVNTQAPPVVIEAMRVDDLAQVLPPPSPAGSRRNLGAGGSPLPAGGSPLRLPPGHRRFEFEYAGLSFAAPERVRFRYRLEGLEQKWVDAGTRRSVNYSYLPPGQYRFQVTACNNDGVWNPTAAHLDFVLAPYLWQSLWFRLLTVAALLAASAAAAWFTTRRRLRRRLERLQMQHAVESERSRIAQDIHDDLGSHLTRITMLSESARANPARTTTDLQLIYSTARELTRAMDEIVWAVNPRHDSLEGLLSYLEKFATDFLRPTGMRCRLDFPMPIPPCQLTADIRHNLFLAFKEALNNAAKHSHGTAVTIQLQLHPAGFLLAVSDNGRGLPTAPHAAPATPGARLLGGDGMENLRRRMARLGGEFRLESEPNGGTRVALYVPLPAAITRQVS